MNNIKRLIVATFVAVLTALSITLVAQAGGPFYITEANLTFVNGVSNQPPQLLSSTSCLNGSCKYRPGSNVSYSINTYRWDYTRAHTWQIYAYCPTIGESVAKYAWRDINIWGVTVNQANINNKGKYVYLGYSDYVAQNTGGYLMLSNDCTGWTCGKKVLFDTMRYNTNP